jgi:carbamoyltransferase
MRVVALNVTHDSSVCSYVDGQIEFYCKEERLTRIKRDKNPYLSLQSFYEKNFGKIDHFLYLIPTNSNDIAFNHYSQYIKKLFDVDLENFSSLLHHDCHASMSFYNSGFLEALVVVIDRNGSVFFDSSGNPAARESESVYYASYLDIIKPIYKSFWSIGSNCGSETKESMLAYYQTKNSSIELNINNSYSIVKAYEAATTLIGENPLENGKTMGLSSYGENLDYCSLFENGKPIEKYFTSLDLGYMGHESDTTCFRGHEDLITNNLTEINFQLYANKAKHVQIETQKEVLRIIKKYVEKTNIKNVCLVGGYGLNVVANNFYIKNLPEVNFYFEPLSDDSGVSIGACMLKYRTQTKDKKIYILNDNFYHYYDKEDNTVLGKTKKIKDLVKILKNQKILAIFDGNPESGPRSLGHRSLLFDPRNKNGKNIVNTLKNREWYRPFAGIILEDHFEKYFETLGIKKSEFMTISFECKDGVKEYVPSIIHIDNTCRIQTVSSSNKFLFELLTEFHNQTGCPMLLNTSFNLAGDPLVQTKNDVIYFTSRVKNNSFFGGTFFVDTKTLFLDLEN